MTPLAIGVLAAATLGFRVLGLWLGEDLPHTLRRVADLVPVALLGALVVTTTVAGDGATWAIDARLAGLAGALLAVALRANLLVVVAVAASVTAVVEWVGG